MRGLPAIPLRRPKRSCFAAAARVPSRFGNHFETRLRAETHHAFPNHVALQHRQHHYTQSLPSTTPACCATPETVASPFQPTRHKQHAFRNIPLAICPTHHPPTLHPPHTPPFPPAHATLHPVQLHNSPITPLQKKHQKKPPLPIGEPHSRQSRIHAPILVPDNGTNACGNRPCASRGCLCTHPRAFAFKPGPARYLLHTLASACSYQQPRHGCHVVCCHQQCSRAPVSGYPETHLRT